MCTAAVCKKAFQVNQFFLSETVLPYIFFILFTRKFLHITLLAVQTKTRLKLAVINANWTSQEPFPAHLVYVFPFVVGNRPFFNDNFIINAGFI